MILLMNFAKSTLLYLLSGGMNLTFALRRLIVYSALGFAVPYKLRPRLRPSTPRLSKVPRITW